MKSRPYLVTAVITAVLLIVWVVWDAQRRRHLAPSNEQATTQSEVAKPSATAPQDLDSTTVWAHNVRLRKGPDFRIYVRWLRGHMERTSPDRIPSLEAEDSFIFAIDKGLIRANLADITKYLNATFASRSPLKNISLDGSGNQLKLSGTLHKVIALPVEITTSASPMADGRVHLHVEKIDVLKVPVKALMKTVSVKLPDILGEKPINGMEVQDNDLYLDTSRMLPPPHIRGKIATLVIHRPDVIVTYGDSPSDESELSQWHNFLRLRGGAVSFGRLTMNNADLTLIDASKETWFDLDLANYQKQLIRGYSRITTEGGLEMFMPSIDRQISTDAITLGTLKNKDEPLLPPPAGK